MGRTFLSLANDASTANVKIILSAVCFLEGEQEEGRETAHWLLIHYFQTKSERYSYFPVIHSGRKKGTHIGQGAHKERDLKITVQRNFGILEK